MLPSYCSNWNPRGWCFTISHGRFMMWKYTNKVNLQCSYYNFLRCYKSSYFNNFDHILYEFYNAIAFRKNESLNKILKKKSRKDE